MKLLLQMQIQQTRHSERKAAKAQGRKELTRFWRLCLFAFSPATRQVQRHGDEPTIGIISVGRLPDVEYARHRDAAEATVG